MKTYVILLLSGCLLILAVGCKQIGGGGGPTQPEEEVAVWSLDPENLPPDVKLVLLALLERMRGRSGEDVDVDFPASAGRVVENDFVYDDFVLSDVIILEYVDEGEGANSRIHLAVSLVWEDMLGRRTATYVQLIYGRGEERLFVEQAMVSQIYPDFPQVRMLYVPETAFREDSGHVFSTWYDLYLFALNNGVALNSPQTSTAQTKYVAVCFVMDRIAPNAEFTLILDDKRTGTSSGTDEFSHCYDFQGWRVGILGFNHTLNAGKTLYIKAVYETEEFGKQLVGSFSTKQD
ncbi:MAG: hypothetical protein D6E12_01805 [Desulfovibrio sp.]|nr:MAG: hypothetical protein D6E12_01805 [Desulfovibrio sp.]